MQRLRLRVDEAVGDGSLVSFQERKSVSLDHPRFSVFVGQNGIG